MPAKSATAYFRPPFRVYWQLPGEKRPNLIPLLSKAQRVIATWSYVDILRFQMLANFLKADISVVTRMLQAVKAQGAQFMAIAAAAQQALTDADHKLFQAALATLKASNDTRDAFAHHAWGIAFADPLLDALMLLDPKLLVRNYAKQFESMTTGVPLTAEDAELPWDNIYAYFDSDFEEQIAEANRAHVVSSTLVEFTSPRASVERVEAKRQELMADARIVETLRKRT